LLAPILTFLVIKCFLKILVVFWLRLHRGRLRLHRGLATPASRPATPASRLATPASRLATPASRPNWRKSFLRTESSPTHQVYRRRREEAQAGPQPVKAAMGGGLLGRPPPCRHTPTPTHTMLGDTSPGVAAASEDAASNTSGGSGATGAQKAPGPTSSEAEESRTSNSRDIKMLVLANTKIPNTV
jgi:hypothetical protein